MLGNHDVNAEIIFTQTKRSGDLKQGIVIYWHDSAVSYSGRYRDLSGVGFPELIAVLLVSTNHFIHVHSFL